MPETRIEWGLLVLGLAVLAVLGTLIGLSVRDEDPATPTTAARGETTVKQADAMPSPAETDPPATSGGGPPKSTSGTASPRPKPKPRTEPRPTGVRLRLTASRGASWLEVRSGSASGTVLFSGTLARGATKLFRAARLWVRFGGASNLDARVNGRAVALRFGTYDTLVTAAGLRPPA